MNHYTPEQIGIALTELIQLEQETKEINVEYFEQMLKVTHQSISHYFCVEHTEWHFEFSDGETGRLTLPEFVSQFKILLGRYEIECPACKVLHNLHPDCKVNDLQIQSILCPNCEPFLKICPICGEFYDTRQGCEDCLNELPDDDGDAEYCCEFQIHS